MKIITIRDIRKKIVYKNIKLLENTDSFDFTVCNYIDSVITEDLQRYTIYLYNGLYIAVNNFNLPITELMCNTWRK